MSRKHVSSISGTKSPDCKVTGVATSLAIPERGGRHPATPFMLMLLGVHVDGSECASLKLVESELMAILYGQIEAAVALMPAHEADQFRAEAKAAADDYRNAFGGTMRRKFRDQ